MQSTYIIDFFNSIVEYVKNNTSLKINYSPRKSYCNIRTGGKVDLTLRYFKRNNTFSIHAVVKKTDKKEDLRKFYDQNKEELQELMGYEVSFQEEGERNPNWTYLRVIVEDERQSDLSVVKEKIGGLFIAFSEYFIQKWR